MGDDPDIARTVEGNNPAHRMTSTTPIYQYTDLPWLREVSIGRSILGKLANPYQR
jgi:hypothetical protein